MNQTEQQEQLLYANSNSHSFVSSITQSGHSVDSCVLLVLPKEIVAVGWCFQAWLCSNVVS
jgi:hypothetical protein